MGEIIYAAQINSNKTEVDLHNSAKGIYFVKLKDNNENVTNKKIIIQ